MKADILSVFLKYKRASVYQILNKYIWKGIKKEGGKGKVINQGNPVTRNTASVKHLNLIIEYLYP